MRRADGGVEGEREKLYWVADDEGTPLRYDKDPLATFLQRFTAGFIRLLPVDTQL